MVKAYKYSRNYVIDYVHDYYGKHEEIFIPEYQIAINNWNDDINIVFTDVPRTDSPISKSSLIDNDDDNYIPIQFRNYTPSKITEIEISEEDVLKFRNLFELQKQLDNMKHELHKDINKYL